MQCAYTDKERLHDRVKDQYRRNAHQIKHSRASWLEEPTPLA